jgi:hypothetical protein
MAPTKDTHRFLSVAVSPQFFASVRRAGHLHCTEYKGELISSIRLIPGQRPGRLNFAICCGETGVLSNAVGKRMTYRVSYEDGLTGASGARDHEAVKRTEYFRTEYEARNRARQLLEDGDHYAVSLCDSSGTVLEGILLQLQLAAAIIE